MSYLGYPDHLYPIFLHDVRSLTTRTHQPSQDQKRGKWYRLGGRRLSAVILEISSAGIFCQTDFSFDAINYPDFKSPRDINLRIMSAEKTMRAVVFRGPYKVAAEERPVPRIQDAGDIVVKVTYTALCGR